MKKSENDKIDALVKQAFQSAVQAASFKGSVPPIEYRLGAQSGNIKDNRRSPDIFAFVAAALLLFALAPAVLWKDKPALSSFVASAYERGSLEGSKIFFTEVLVQGGKAF